MILNQSLQTYVCLCVLEKQFSYKVFVKSLQIISLIDPRSNTHTFRKYIVYKMVRQLSFSFGTLLVKKSINPQLKYIKGIIKQLSLCRKDSYQGVESWAKQLRASEAENIILAVFGSTKEQIDYEVSKQFAQKQRQIFKFISVKQGKGIKELFDSLVERYQCIKVNQCQILINKQSLKQEIRQRIRVIVRRKQENAVNNE